MSITSIRTGCWKTLSPSAARDRHVLRWGDVVAGKQFGFAQQLEDFDEVTSWRPKREAATHAAILSRGQQLGRCSRAPRQEMGCPRPGSVQIAPRRFSHNSLYRQPLRLSSPDLRDLEKGSVARAMCARHRPAMMRRCAGARSVGVTAPRLGFRSRLRSPVRASGDLTPRHCGTRGSPGRSPGTPASATVTERSAAVHRVHVPAPAPEHTQRALGGSRRIGLRRVLVIGIILVPAPFPHVAVHVVQSECIRSITADWDGPAQRRTFFLGPIRRFAIAI